MTKCKSSSGCRGVWFWVLGDGATIEEMPHLNTHVSFRHAPPVIVSIVDCTSNTSDGMKKVATSLLGKIWKKVDELGQDRMTDWSSLMVHQMSK